MGRNDMESKAGRNSEAERLERICRGEGSSLTDQELLELVLSFSQPGTEAPPLARSLMKRFGSLAGVLNGTKEALESVEGVRADTVRLLRLLRALIGSGQSEGSGQKDMLLHTEDVAEYLRPYFYHARSERAYLLILDSSRRALNCIHLGDGTADSVNIEFAAILRNSMGRECAGCILAHCHLSGSPQPSQQDLDVTACLQEMLEEVGLRLFDHLIFADYDYVSLAQMGLIKETGRNSAKR